MRLKEKVYLQISTFLDGVLKENGLRMQRILLRSLKDQGQLFEDLICALVS